VVLSDLRSIRRYLASTKCKRRLVTGSANPKPDLLPFFCERVQLGAGAQVASEAGGAFLLDPASTAFILADPFSVSADVRPANLVTQHPPSAWA
jgi:hypothetical protein